MMPKLKIVNRAIEALTPYEGNARTHSDLQIDQIAASMSEFGFTNPVLIDEADGIIAGHGRVAAAQRLGWTHLDCIVMKGLTDAQRRAYVIADNKIALNSGWNFELLKAEVAALSAEDFKVELMGFNEGELTNLFLDVEKGETDVEKEWEGMPEFNQNDEDSWHKISVHFECESDLEEFVRLIGQPLTGKTKSVWHPRKKNADLKSLSYE